MTKYLYSYVNNVSSFLRTGAYSASAVRAYIEVVLPLLRAVQAQVQAQTQTPAAPSTVTATTTAPARSAATNPWALMDAWVAEANNASFAAQATYDHWVPAFEALFAQQGSDWRRFYDAVQALADLPQPLREERLRALQPEPESTPVFAALPEQALGQRTLRAALPAALPAPVQSTH